MNRIKICVLSLVMCICLSMFGAGNAQAYTDYQGDYKKSVKVKTNVHGSGNVKIMFGSGDDESGCRKHKMNKSGCGYIYQTIPHMCYTTMFFYKRISKHKYLIYKFQNEYGDCEKVKYTVIMNKKKIVVKDKSKKKCDWFIEGTYKLKRYR